MHQFLLASTATLISASAFAQSCTMPAAAKAAGYTVPTLRGSPTQWNAGSGGSSLGSCGVTQNADGSMHIAGGGCNGYNEQMSSPIAFGGGGYFEATLSFTGGPSQAGGWPAFWGNTQGTDPAEPNIEVDALEVQGGMITHGAFNWLGVGGSQTIATPPTSANNYPPPPTNPDGTPWSWSSPHRYGWLWVPATATTKGRVDFYLDGNLQTGGITWKQGGTFSALDKGNFRLMLGSGPNNPMTVYDVSVWQMSTAQNSGSMNLPVNALTACRPMTAQAPAAILSAAVQQAGAPAATPSVSDFAALAGGGPQSVSSAAPLPSIDPLAAVFSVQPSDPAVAAIVAEAAARVPRQITTLPAGNSIVGAMPEASAPLGSPQAVSNVLETGPTGDGSFLALPATADMQALLAVMTRNADIARPESGGTMVMTLAPGDITPGTGGSAIDKQGNVFTLPFKGGAWGTSMGQPMENGVPIGDGTGWVAAIRIDRNGVACFENAKGLGWGCQGSGTWVSDPGPAAPGSSTGGLSATGVTTATVQTSAVLVTLPSIADVATLAAQDSTIAPGPAGAQPLSLTLASPPTNLTTAARATLQAFEANPGASTLTRLENQLSTNDWTTQATSITTQTRSRTR